MSDMIRNWTFTRGPSASRFALAALLGAALVVLLTLKTGLAAEWTVPPGIDVVSQQSALRERITRAARAMLGENLVDVDVNVGYVRTGRADQPSQSDRVKLPGFNNFIVPSAGAGAEIVPEFTRVRQAVVMVSDQARIQPDSLARELAVQTGMDPAQGDTVRVIAVNAGQRDQPRVSPMEPPVMPGMGRESEEAAMAPRARPAKPITPEELKEPQSTAHLMQARRHYFAGDYQGSLDEILQAVSIDPNNAQAYAMLGSLYYAMNWRSLAVKYWQRSLEIDPSNREIEDLVSQIRIQNP